MRKLKILAKRILKIKDKIYYPILKLKNKRVNIFNEYEARKILQSYSEKPGGIIAANNKLNVSVDLMIIIPAYNVSGFIEKCVDSILAQPIKYSYEIVVVNDGSTDNTLDKLNKYSSNEKVRIIDQENRGFSGSRNRALENITGKYVMFVDSDDYLLPDSINLLMDIATEKNADIVEGAAYSFYETDNGERRNQYFYHNQEGEVKDISDLLGYPWGKVFKAELFKDIKFPEGFWYEDTILSMLVYWNSSKSYVTNKMVYAYRINSNGITQISKSNPPKTIDTYWITEAVAEEQHNKNMLLGEHTKQFINQVAMNYSRTKRHSEEIRIAIFSLTCRLYENYYKEHSVELEKYREKELIKAIQNKNFYKAEAVLACWKGLN